jgi:hypothetical protein
MWEKIRKTRLRNIRFMIPFGIDAQRKPEYLLVLAPVRQLEDQTGDLGTGEVVYGGEREDSAGVGGLSGEEMGGVSFEG